MFNLVKLIYCFLPIIFISLYQNNNMKKIKNRQVSGYGDEVIMDPDQVVEVKSKKKGCSSCKQDGLKPGQWFMVVLGFYILFASVYGTIQLVKLLF